MEHLLRSALGLAFLLLLSFSVSAQGRAMEVIFTPDMDKTALEKIQVDAMANGLELQYTRLERKDERITAMAFVLKTKKGMGTAETEELSAEKPFGFSYDPRAGKGEASFSVGSMAPEGADSEDGH